MTPVNFDTPRFRFAPTPLAGVWQLARKPFVDARGSFMRSYCAHEFQAIGLTRPIVQINQSASARRGTVRGLHFQHPPHGETKIVTCVRGRILDVALDLRAGSRTFLRWFATELSAANQQGLIIPPGVAHGYQTLEDDAEVMYLVDAPYRPDCEDGVNPFDPAAAIAWPLPASEVSARDAQRAHLDVSTFAGLAGAHDDC